VRLPRRVTPRTLNGATAPALQGPRGATGATGPAGRPGAVHEIPATLGNTVGTDQTLPVMRMFPVTVFYPD
jgi:hypothetical protein